MGFQKKKKVNNPPKYLDCQDIPKSGQRLKDLQKQIEEDYLQRKRRRKIKLQGPIDTAELLTKHEGEDLKGFESNLKFMKTIKQKKKEKDYYFMKRLSAVTKSMVQESNFEKKYDVNVVRNERGIVLQIQKDKSMKQKCLEAKKKYKDKKLKQSSDKANETHIKNGSNIVNSDTENDTQIRKSKRKHKAKSVVDFREQELFGREKLKFGEVVHRPPKLTIKSNKSGDQKTKKDFLFMDKLRTDPDGNRMLNADAECLARKQLLQQERERAITLYRQMKREKQGHHI